MKTGFVHPEYLVSTDWLARQLNNPQVRVVDFTTHTLPRPDLFLYDIVSGRADFEKAHIPGATFVDIDHDVSAPHPRLHFMLPSPEQFANVMGSLGIGDETRVVAYSTANHWWATRLWWMLRVFGHDDACVLDGGFQKWQREARPVQSGPPQASSAVHFTPRYRAELIATKEDVLAAVGTGQSCTVNALRREQHAGTGGVHYGRRGHIKGSINLPAVEHIRQDNTFKGADELRAMFAPALARPEVITYCGGGIAATSAALALAMLGYDRVKVYDNSLTEWAADPSLPMETGA